MANSTQSALSNGTLALLQVSIEYLDRADINVYFDGVPDALPWEWVGDSDRSIAFSPPVPTGVTVQLRRLTDVDRIRHNFTLGAKFANSTLDENFLQTLMVAQEYQEGARLTDLFNDLDMHGFRILNAVADGGAGFSWLGNWVPGKQYFLNNLVYITEGPYEGYSMICTTSHTSGLDFQSDYLLSRWSMLTARGASGSGSGDLVASNNLSDVASTASALANLQGVPLSGGTLTGPLLVPDLPYDETSWASSLAVPTRKALRDKFESLPEKATESQANIGSDDVSFMTSLRVRDAIRAALSQVGSAPIYANRAWVNFDGASGIIRNSANVLGVMKNAVGDFTILFMVPMPASTYSIQVTAGNGSLAGAYSINAPFANPTSGGVRIGIATVSTPPTLVDAGYINVLVTI